VRSKFAKLREIMTLQEMGSNITRASQFLEEVHALKFYCLVYQLQATQDNMLREKKGQKEVYGLQSVIEDLCHHKDLKITLNNGFHVNTSVTHLDRVNVDAHCYNHDFESFDRCVQPSVEEKALNPPEWSLVDSIYNSSSTNMRTYKSPRYLGALQKRDYASLDYSLTNLSKDFRRYIASSIEAVETQLKTFVLAKQNQDEAEYESNPTVYKSIMMDKKQFLKIQLKARQLKRIYMTILTKQPVPLNLNKYAEVNQKYLEAVQWKIQAQHEIVLKARKRPTNNA